MVTVIFPAASNAWHARWRGREDSSLLRRLLLVTFFIEIGLLLIVVPWSTFWDRNYFVYAWPALRPILTNDFVRGAVSGLGLVNLFAGFLELRPMFEAPRRQELPS